MHLFIQNIDIGICSLSTRARLRHSENFDLTDSVFFVSRTHRPKYFFPLQRLSSNRPKGGEKFDGNLLISHFMNDFYATDACLPNYIAVNPIFFCFFQAYHQISQSPIMRVGIALSSPPSPTGLFVVSPQVDYFVCIWRWRGHRGGSGGFC